MLSTFFCASNEESTLLAKVFDEYRGNFRNLVDFTTPINETRDYPMYGGARLLAN